MLLQQFTCTSKRRQFHKFSDRQLITLNRWEISLYRTRLTATRSRCRVVVVVVNWWRRCGAGVRRPPSTTLGTGPRMTQSCRRWWSEYGAVPINTHWYCHLVVAQPRQQTGCNRYTTTIARLYSIAYVQEAQLPQRKSASVMHFVVARLLSITVIPHTSVYVFNTHITVA